MKDTALIFCTHFISPAIISEYRKMKNTQSAGAFLLVNNSDHKIDVPHGIRKMEFYGMEVDCLFIDENLNEGFKLPYWPYTKKEFGKTIWYCGDYRFYYFKKYYPDYAYYWTIDYDVFCNSTDGTYRGFLERYCCNPSDCIIQSFREVKLNGPWSWSRGVEWIYQNVKLYGGFFPAVRLSARAVDFLYARRLEHMQSYTPRETFDHSWPGCELFTVTELMNAGYSCCRIDEPRLRLEPRIDLNHDRVFEIPDDHLYHPVK